MEQSIFKVHFVLKLLATVLWLSQQGEFATELCLDADQAAQRLSCNFSGGNFCGWKNSQEDNHDWKGGREHIYVDSTNKTTARLESPLVCATGGSLFEIKFRYIFGTYYGGCQLALYLETASGRSEVTTLTSHFWFGFNAAGPYYIKCAGEPFKIILEARKSVDKCGLNEAGHQIDDMHIISINKTIAIFTHCPAEITQSLTQSPFSATGLDLLTPEADSNTSKSPSNTTLPTSKTSAVQTTSLSNTTSPTSKTPTVQTTSLSNTTSPPSKTSAVQTTSLSNTTSPTSKTSALQKTLLSNEISPSIETSTAQTTSLSNTTSLTTETSTVQTTSLSNTTSLTTETSTVQTTSLSNTTSPTIKISAVQKTLLSNTTSPTTETFTVQTESLPQSPSPTSQTHTLQTKAPPEQTKTPNMPTKTPTVLTETPTASTEIATGQSEALPKTSESASPSNTASLSKSSTSSLVETEEEGGLSGLTVASIVLAAVAVVVVIGFVVRRVRHRREGLFKRWRSSTGYLITPVGEDGRCRVTYKPARFASLDDDTDDGVSLPLRITDNHDQPV